MDALEEIWKAVKHQFPDIFKGCCVPTPTDFPLFRDGMRIVYASDNKDHYKDCVVPLAGTVQYNNILIDVFCSYYFHTTQIINYYYFSQFSHGKKCSVWIIQSLL